MKLKNNNGIGLSDTIIAIGIFILFSGAIISISYNIYIQSNFIKRNDTATNYIVELLEFAKTKDVEEVSYDTLSGYIKAKYENSITLTSIKPNDKSIGKGYTMYIIVKDPHTENPDLYEENFVKEIETGVYYKLADKVKKVIMKTLVSK